MDVKGNPVQYIKSYISGINKIVSEIKPNIISVCDDGLKAFFTPIIIRRKIPIVYERHVSRNVFIGSEKLSPTKAIKIKLLFSLMNYLGAKFTKFIVLTNDNLSEWNLKNLEVIPNPLTFFPDEVSGLENKTVIAVGKHCYQKSYDRLLQSWQIVNAKNPDWKLKIFGKIDKNQGLIALAKNLKIENSVQFFPPEKNIQSKYLESSIFVLSSRYEGFGMVLIEAMACGVPCVSFDCPCGPKDIVADNNDGFLVKNGAIETFANKINYLVQNKEIRHNFGQNARENVKRFQPEIVVNRWDKLFKEIAQ